MSRRGAYWGWAGLVLMAGTAAAEPRAWTASQAAPLPLAASCTAAGDTHTVGSAPDVVLCGRWQPGAPPRAVALQLQAQDTRAYTLLDGAWQHHRAAAATDAYTDSGWRALRCHDAARAADEILLWAGPATARNPTIAEALFYAQGRWQLRHLGEQDWAAYGVPMLLRCPPGVSATASAAPCDCAWRDAYQRQQDFERIDRTLPADALSEAGPDAPWGRLLAARLAPADPVRGLLERYWQAAQPPGSEEDWEPPPPLLRVAAQDSPQLSVRLLRHHRGPRTAEYLLVKTADDALQVVRAPVYDVRSGETMFSGRHFALGRDDVLRFSHRLADEREIVLAVDLSRLPQEGVLWFEAPTAD